MKKVLFIAPHPDDEALSCGTLLKHKKYGDKVFCVYVTMSKNKTELIKKTKYIEKVQKKLNFDKYFIGKSEPTKISKKNLTNVIDFLRKIIISIKPSVLYIPNGNDIHSDHRLIYDACVTFTKSFRYNSINEVLVYETLSETNFGIRDQKKLFYPNTFVDISKFFKQKIEICKIYKSEIGSHPFPRSILSIKSNAIMRGSYANCKYAEAFMALKLLR